MNRPVFRRVPTFHQALVGSTVAGLLAFSSIAAADRPTKPSNLTSSIKNQQVVLQWTASTDDNAVAGYNVYINGKYTKTVFANRYVGELDTSIDNELYVTAFDEPLENEKRSYSSRSDRLVIAAKDKDSDDDSDDDDSGSGGGIDTQRPSSPTGFTLISALSEAISFSWDVAFDNVGTVGYNIYRDGDYFDTVFTHQYVDDAPLFNTDNVYAVVAFDKARNYSSKSEEFSIRVGDKPKIDSDPDKPGTPPKDPDPPKDNTRPSIPTQLSVTVANSANYFTWQAASDNVKVDGYNVYRNDDYLTTTRDTSFNDTEVGVDETYTYSVVAFDDARNFSSRSDNVSLQKQTDDPDKPKDPDQRPPNDDSGEKVPDLDPSNRFSSPNPADPFGSLLEVDTEEPVPGGAPTTPKNLRFDLVSNNWAEISWAPANDDEGVVAYRIYRSDGVTYEISQDKTGASGGALAEIDKYWSTTSFIDCNYTRFDTLVHNCRANQPVPGQSYTYQVSAVDAQGQESPYSAPLSITYHLEQNAPVPIFDDFYKQPDDRFAQSNDFSETRFFLDEFDLVFSDEFESTSLDATKWQTELTWKDSTIINGEQQYFVRIQDDPEFGYDPFSFDGDNLTISAIQTPDNLVDKLPSVCSEADPTGNARCQFLSGALSTHDRFSFLYGYVEGRMKPSGVSGALSSFFLYHRYKGSGVNMHAPEIDILEYLGENPYGAEDAFQTYHFDDVNSGLTRSAPTMSHANPTGELYSDDFHTFGVLWEPQLIIWYIDGQEVQRITGPMVSRQPMNIVNYLVAGSAWAPTPDTSDSSNFPLEFDVDYIRVFQRDAYKGTASFGR